MKQNTEMNRDQEDKVRWRHIFEVWSLREKNRKDKKKMINLMIPSRHSIVPESFGEWIMVNFKLSYLKTNEEKKIKMNYNMILQTALLNNVPECVCRNNEWEVLTTTVLLITTFSGWLCLPYSCGICQLHHLWRSLNFTIVCQLNNKRLMYDVTGGISPLNFSSWKICLVCLWYIMYIGYSVQTFKTSTKDIYL